MPYTPRTRRNLLALALSCVLGLATSANADTLTLMWDLNDEPEVNGYLVYIGTESGLYSQTVDVQNTDTYVFSQALPGQRYYFAVAAYAGDLLSPLSEEVSGISNEFPTLAAVGNQASPLGANIALQLDGGDPRGDALTYTASGLPPGLMLSQTLGLISGVTTAVGSYAVTVTVSDGVLSASRSFSWEVFEGNVAPTLAAPGTQTSLLGQADELLLQGADANGDPLSYTASGLPSGMQLTAATGRIAGTPAGLGTYAVTVTVSDGSLSASRSFTWTIVEFNSPPALAQPANQTDTVGQSAVLQLQGADLEGDTLTYTASGLPPGLQLTASTGRIAGTPSAAGTYQVSVSVSDGTAAAGRSFTWMINAGNTAPTLARPSNQSSIVGQSVVLQLQGADADGDRLTYTAAGLPPGLQIAAATGRIDGTLLAGGRFSVTIVVTDGMALMQRGFTWTVTAPVTVGDEPEDPADPTGTRAVARQRTKNSVYTGAAAMTRTEPNEDPAAARTFTGTAALQRQESADLATGGATVTYTGTRALARSSVTGGDPEPPSTSSGTESVTSAKASIYEGVTLSISRETGAGATQTLVDHDQEGDLTGGMSGAQNAGTLTAMTGAPAVSIQTPVNGAAVTGTSSVIFSGVAYDATDGDLSSRIVWSSSLDGRLGTGALFHAELTAGTHVISATVTDDDGASRTAQVTVDVAP